MEFFRAPLERAEGRLQGERMRERLNSDGYGWWILERKDGPEFAGVIALQEVPFDAPCAPALEVGWRLHPDAWGNGLATEGARAAIAFAFERLDRAEVVAMTAAINVRSRRVMERLGMTHAAADDFEHPWVDAGHRLRRHVLYRLRRDGAGASGLLS